MYTTRGYRRASKENKSLSRQGQIIQKKPGFQIDNNPVVLNAYKRYLTQGKSLLINNRSYDTHEVTLSEFGLSWNSSQNILDIYSLLNSFAASIFNQYEEQGKYPVSLVLYSPNLIDSNAWTIMAPIHNGTCPIFEKINSIIIDIMGNISLTQNGDGIYTYARYIYSTEGDFGTIGYTPFEGTDDPTYSSPAKMKCKVYYLDIYK